jgi:hypothetical protein
MTIVYNTENHCVSALYTLPGILNGYKTQSFGNYIYFYLQVGEGINILCWVPWKGLV